MARYHLNGKGEPGLCRATKHCPFGDIQADHYESKDEARAAYEATMATKLTPKQPQAYDDLSLEDFGELEERTLAEKLLAGEPYTDEEYERHREYIRRVNKATESTHKLHTVKIKSKVTYTTERRALQEEILAQLEERFRDVPSEKKAIFSGGMPGAGKSTVLRTEVEPALYAQVNPDDVKEIMLERGVYPKVRGLLPLEHDQSIRYEAQLVSDELFARLTAQGKNVIIDKTLSNYGPILKNIQTLRAHGYEQVEAIFVDVDGDTAYRRIRARHKEGLDNYVRGMGQGERCVPGSVVAGSVPDNPRYNSKNAEVLVKLNSEGHFTSKPRVFDNSGEIPVLLPAFLED